MQPSIKNNFQNITLEAPGDFLSGLLGVCAAEVLTLKAGLARELAGAPGQWRILSPLEGGLRLAAGERRRMSLEDVMTGFSCMESIGRLFGEDNTFFTGMVEGINEKMNIDLLGYLKDPKAREVLYAEVLIQGILSGRTVDMDEIEANFQNRRMVDTIRRYLAKADGLPETTA